MGQAKRRKELGKYPLIENKQRKRARIKQDFETDIMRQAFTAIALSTVMLSQHRLPEFIRKG